MEDNDHAQKQRHRDMNRDGPCQLSVEWELDAFASPDLSYAYYDIRFRDANGDDDEVVLASVALVFMCLTLPYFDRSRCLYLHGSPCPGLCQNRFLPSR